MATSKENYIRDTKNIWFPSQKEPEYTADNIDVFLKYWKKEKDRILNGFRIADGKVFISGWMYWNTVYWKIKMKKTVNGRTFPVIATPDLRDLEWDAAINFESALDEGTFIELVGSRGFGKFLENSEPLIYQDGEKPIGDCKVGDKIYGRDGKLTKITGVFPQGKQDVYELKLLDGRVSKCGLDHLWGVYKKGVYKVLKTKDLIEDGLKVKHKKSGYTYKYYLPEIEPIQFPKNNLPIDPYVLGALLGDGKCSSSVNIASLDKEILDEFKSRLPDYELVLDSGKNNTGCNISYHITYKGKDKYTTTFYDNSCKGVNPLFREIKKLNLNTTSLKKFIPNIYKYSSIEQRMDLLCGLMDTDGSINTSGSIEFTSGSKQLAEDVLYIARSLGIRGEIGVDDRIGEVHLMPQGTLRTVDKIYYRVYLRTDLPIFKLKRKLNRIVKRKNTSRVAISDIKLVSNSECTCISVNNVDKLFLTKDFIPTHNTVWQSSYAARIFSMIDKSQVVVSGGNSADIKVVTDKIAEGLLSLHPVLKKKTLKKDWKLELLAGFKNPDGEVSEKSSQSQILMRNYRDGNDSMAANGTRPDFHIIDEIGKINNFLRCVKDSDGCWWANDILEEGKVKPTCLPMFSGTGGDFEVGKDAAEMFFDPLNNNLLAFDDVWEGKGKIGWFVPATKARYEYKFPQKLSKYLGIDHPDLDAISILVSDEERCLKEWWQPRYDKALKSGNSNSLTSFKAYWPLVPSDCFLVLKQNDFNVEAAQAQRKRLLANGVTGTPVNIFHDGEKLTHEISEKLFITEYPVKTQSKDAPVQVWEFPIDEPGKIPFGLYTAGVDPYRHGEAEYSDSLGSVYIFKRMQSISGERYQNMFVAAYAARPESKATWNETARNLIKYYNARTLCENDEYGFIDYMIAKGDSHYLEYQPDWLKEIVANTSVKRDFGIHRSALGIRNFLDSTFKHYLDEAIDTEKDENGAIIKETLGVTRIKDPMLLEEVCKFSKSTKKGEKTNTDRVVAAELAVALAFKLDPLLGAIKKVDGRIEALYKQRKQKSLFSSTSVIRKTRNKIFT